MEERSSIAQTAPSWCMQVVAMNIVLPIGFGIRITLKHGCKAGVCSTTRSFMTQSKYETVQMDTLVWLHSVAMVAWSLSKQVIASRIVLPAERS